jgi:hypothetical protein
MLFEEIPEPRHHHRRRIGQNDLNMLHNLPSLETSQRCTKAEGVRRWGGSSSEFSVLDGPRGSAVLKPRRIYLRHSVGADKQSIS